MCLVLKEQQPRLVSAVNVYGYPDRAGVYLLALVEAVEHPALLQHTRGDGGDVHQTYGLCSAYLASCGKIFVICRAEQRIVKAHAVYLGKKGGVTAVIRPVGIYHSQLGEGRVAVLAAEILAAEGDVRLIHCESVFGYHIAQPLVGELGKAVKSGHTVRWLGLACERLGQRETALSCLDGVDNVFFYLFKVALAERAAEQIYLCRAYCRSASVRDELDALCGAVCALIELSGQILDGEYREAVGGDVAADYVELRLGKDGAGRIVEQLCVDILGIVATDDAYALERGYSEQSAQLGAEAARLVCELRLLFYIYSVNHLCFLRFTVGRSLQPRVRAVLYHGGRSRFQNPPYLSVRMRHLSPRRGCHAPQ